MHPGLQARPPSLGSSHRADPPGKPGPPRSGWVGAVPRGGSAAVLETCLPQNSQIFKNNSGGFCLAFALKDFFPFTKSSAAGKVRGAGN